MCSWHFHDSYRVLGVFFSLNFCPSHPLLWVLLERTCTGLPDGLIMLSSPHFTFTRFPSLSAYMSWSSFEFRIACNILVCSLKCVRAQYILWEKKNPYYILILKMFLNSLSYIISLSFSFFHWSLKVRKGQLYNTHNEKNKKAMPKMISREDWFMCFLLFNFNVWLPRIFEQHTLLSLGHTPGANTTRRTDHLYFLHKNWSVFPLAQAGDSFLFWPLV